MLALIVFGFTLYITLSGNLPMYMDWVRTSNNQLGQKQETATGKTE